MECASQLGDTCGVSSDSCKVESNNELSDRNSEFSRMKILRQEQIVARDAIKKLNSLTYNCVCEEQIKMITVEVNKIIDKVVQKSNEQSGLSSQNERDNIHVLPLTKRTTVKSWKAKRTGTKAASYREHSKLDIFAGVEVPSGPTLPEGFLVDNHIEQCNEVKRVWNGDNFETKWVGPYIITKESIVDIKNKLPDEVMDAFLFNLTAQLPGVLHINCCTLTGIFDANENIHHCLRGESNLLHYNTIIGAHNEGGGHWVLINLVNKCKFEKKGTYENKFLKLRQECGLESELPTTYEVQLPVTAIQHDNTSCGLFTLKFAENYLGKKALAFSWNPTDIENARLSLAAFLLSISQLPQSLDVGEDVEIIHPQEPVVEDSLLKPVVKDTLLGKVPKSTYPGRLKLKKGTVRRVHSSKQIEGDEDTDGAKESDKHMYPSRDRKAKRKRTSFLYWLPKKRQRKMYCICRKPDDRRIYWCCDRCDEWYHPSCIGRLEEDEPDQFYCPYCTDTEVEDADDLIDMGSDEEGPRKDLQSKRIIGKTALENYDEAVELEVITCVNSKCSEVGHKRHHQFVLQPLTVSKNEKKKFGFGQQYNSQTVLDVLTEKLRKDYIVQIPDKKNPATSIPIHMIRHVPVESQLWKLFMEDKFLAMQYILCVLLKELIVLIASTSSGAPYEFCEQTCLETELDSREIFGI